MTDQAEGEGSARALSSAGTPQVLDVAIVGGSVAGLALACALADARGPQFAIGVIEAGSLELVSTPDVRAFAISAGAGHLLESVGAWPELAGHAQPMTAIDITDSDLSDAVRPVLLSYENVVDGEPGTSIVESQRLRSAILAAARRRPTIRLFGGVAPTALAVDDAGAELRLSDASVLRASLLVAADGGRSWLRERAGIKTVAWSYPQSGIVTTVTHERPHNGRGVQNFLPGGPFAILPMTDSASGKARSCITWSEDAEVARRILALDDVGFLAEIERRFSFRLRRPLQAGPRQSWPLAMHLARSLIAPRLALVGDAAHGVHPIAGQGLNLGLRDVAALAEVLADAARLGLDIGSATVLERYEQWRRLDAAMSAATFDALNRLFSSTSLPLRTVRSLGLGLVDRVPELKRWLVAEAAGLTGDVPRLLRGERI